MVWDMANLGFRQVKNSMFPYCQRPGWKVKSSLSIISLNYPLYMTALQIANSRVTLFQSEYTEHYSVSILSLSLTNLLPPWKILNKMKWRAEWDLNNLGRGYFQEKKKKNVKIISDGNQKFYYFSLLWGSQTLMSSFIIHVLRVHYGLSTLLDVKPTKTKREKKTVPAAYPALNWIAVWEMAKYNRIRQGNGVAHAGHMLLKQPEGPWPNISVGRGASGEIKFYPFSLWRLEFIRFQSLLPLGH